MGSNYLGRAGAYAMHKRYPTGQQTAAQLTAERRNLIIARQKRGEFRHTRSARYEGLRAFSYKQAGDVAAGRAYKHRDIFFEKYRTVGVRYIRLAMRQRPKRRIRLTGINRKFRSHIGPSRYLGRTSWGASRAPTFHKHIGKRQRRFKTVRRWKGRGKLYTPR